jgi:hypothetical protein
MSSDPYRHQELQFEYYEPASMHRPMMSGPWPLVVFVALDVWYGVWLCLDYWMNGAAFFGLQALLLAFVWWSRR